MTIDAIVTLSGNLRDAYNQAVPGTVLCVDQLNKERIALPKLNDFGTYTADGNVYSLDGITKTPTWRITREVSRTKSGLFVVNPILKNIDRAYEQLVHTSIYYVLYHDPISNRKDYIATPLKSKNYFVTPADFEAVKSANETITIDLTKLELEETNDPSCSLLWIETSKELSRYSAEMQKVLFRFFGPTEEDYFANMNKLITSPQPIKKTKISILNPDYVQKEAAKGPIERTSFSYVADGPGAYFSADFSTIYHKYSFSGVRRTLDPDNLFSSLRKFLKLK